MSNLPGSNSNRSSAHSGNNQQGHPNDDISTLLANAGRGAASARGALDRSLLQRMAMQNHAAIASRIASQQQMLHHQQQPRRQGQRIQHGGPPSQGGATAAAARASPQQHQRMERTVPLPQQQQPRLSGMLSGGAEALRTLALMKSLGVSPSATALAAAVLPNTALPKTAAAVTAAAAVNQRPSAGVAAAFRHKQQHNHPGGMVPNPLRPQGGVGATNASVSGRPPSVGASSSTSSPRNHPKKLLLNERNNRSNMLRTYGEENPLFYERLVQLVGKKDADEMVREAVDETIKEEVEGKGGNEVKGHCEQDIISIADSSEEEREDEKILKPAPRAHSLRKPPSSPALVPPTTTVTTAAKATAPPIAQITVPKVVAAAPPSPAQLFTTTTTPVPFSPLYNSVTATADQNPKKRKADGMFPPKTVTVGPKGPKRPKAYSHALPIPPSGPAKANLLRSLFGRPSAATTAPLPPGAGIATVAATLATAKTGEEPPGFEQFKADPKFCVLLFECAKKWKQSMVAKKAKSVGGLFVHGLLNIKDDELLNSLDESDPSIQAYVKDVITPYLNVPSNLVESEGKWEAYIHISKEDINEFAKTIVYQRRKAMKSAVSFALYEIAKNRQSMLSAGAAKNSKPPAATIKAAMEAKKKETEKDERIKELEQQLASEKEKHATEIKALEDRHSNENTECENEYTEFVAKMLKTHRKEMNELKRGMKDMQNVHKTFLDSYVEASVDALRNNYGSPNL